MRRDWLGWGLCIALLAGCASGGDEHAGAGKKTRNPDGISASGSANLGLAQSYLQRNELKAALDRANRALQSDPDAGTVHAMLGLIYDRVGDQGHATASFARALALAPTEGAVLNAHGSWLCSHGDFAAAAAQFDRALADPFFQRKGLVHFNVGHCALKAGDNGRAEAAFRRALDVPGAEPASVLFALAQVELAQGKLLEARAFVQRRVALGATAEVLELAARIEEASGDRAAAERYRRRIPDAAPDPGAAGEGAMPL
jgi:type IV pilus assembly protein PilF